MKYAFYFLLLILIIACGDNEDPDQAQCENISIVSEFVTAMDTVFVNEVMGNYDIEFWKEGKYTEMFMVLEVADDGRRFFIAPLDPDDVLASTTIDVRFISEESRDTCETLPLSINALPAAPGYSEAVGAAMQRLIIQRAETLDIAPEDYQAPNFSGDLDMLPFFASYNIIANTESELSFISLITNDAVIPGMNINKEENIKLLNRLLKSSDILQVLEDDISTFEDRVDGFRKEKSEVDSRSDCDGLTEAMIASEFGIVQDARSYSDPNGAKFKRFREMTNKVGLAGLAPGAGTASALLGALIWSYQKFYEGIENVYFSEITSGTLTFDKTDYLEEEACDNIPWPSYEISVANKGWKMSTSKFELVLQTVGLLASFKGWNSKLDETLAGAFVMSTSTVLTDLQSQLGPGDVDVERTVCGPIKISLENMYGKVSSGDAVIVDNDAKTITPYKTGTSEVEVGLVSGNFAGVQSSKQTSITITGPAITWLPAGSINANTNEILNLEALLVDNLLVDVTVIADEGSNSDVEVLIDGELTNYVLEHTTPSDPTLFPYNITIEYQSDLCLRGTDQSSPVFSIVRITNGGSIGIVTPNQACYEAGVEIDLDVTAAGTISDEVDWSVTYQDGSFPFISDDGIFTPDKDGDYYVTAVLREDPSITDSLFILVSDCSCQFEFESVFAQRSGTFASYSTTFGFAQIGGEDGNFQVTLQLLNGAFPSEGESTSFSVGSEDGYLSGSYDDDKVFYGPEENESLQVSLTNVGGDLEGRISGKVGYADGNTVVGISEMVFTFRAGFSDPLQGIEACE